MGNSGSFNPKTDRHPTAIHKAFDYTPDSIREALYDLVEELTVEFGRPPYGIEVSRRYHSKGWHLMPAFMNMWRLYDMARDDIFYTDRNFDLFATKKLNDKFMKVSERILTQPEFKGLKLDDEMSLRNDTRGAVNLAERKSILLSKDMAKAADYQKRLLDDKVQRFLDGSSIAGDRVAY